jgi:HEPN domain-containing protein
MKEEKVNIEVAKIVNHWIETSEDDFQTMLNLFDSKSYSWSLFLGHISVEKLLKAVYISKHKKTCSFSS